MKKFLAILISLISVCLISSCGCSVERENNYEPNPEDYVEWDGNYFYYQNYRITTDLSVEEPYITEVVYNENTYEIDKVHNSVFKNDKLHMTFSTEVNSSKESEQHFAFVIYSLESQKVEYLYLQEHTEAPYNNDLFKILEIGDNYVILQGNGKISKLDTTSSKIDFINCVSYEVKYGYAAVMYDNQLLYSDLETFDFKPIMSLSNQNTKIDYFIQNIDGQTLLQIIDQSGAVVNNKSITVSSLTYYDFESKEFYELVKFEDNKFLSIDPNKKCTDIFILGEQKLVGYNGYTSDDTHLEYKLFTDKNVLYTVTFNKINGVELKELYAFNESNEYKINQFENNIIHLSKRTLNKPVNHMYYNRIDNKIEYFDLDKMKILDKAEHDYNNRIVIAEFGDIVYYVEIKIQTAFMAESTVYYYLYRHDKRTQKTGLLKYFVDYLSDSVFDNYVFNDEKYDFDILVRSS